MRILNCILVITTLTTARPQGMLTFNNRTETGDVPVTLSDGAGPGPLMQAGLYVLREGNFELIETTPFRTGAEPRPKFFQAKEVQIPGIPPGSPATFRIRVWPSNIPSFEEAVTLGGCYGEFLTTNGSPNIIIPALGDPDPIGGAPENFPTPNGIVPLEIPCRRDPQNESLQPVIKLSHFQTGTADATVQIKTGFLGRPIQIHQSTNLLTWTNVALVAPQTNSVTISTPLSAGCSAEFFQATIEEEQSIFSLRMLSPRSQTTRTLRAQKNTVRLRP
jgi:hypothetical protein